MKTALPPITDVMLRAARGWLREDVTIGAATLLPRGADLFIGAEKPLLLGATRWAMVSPGGVILGGTPAAMAAVLGFDAPEKLPPVAAGDRDPNEPPPPKWSTLVMDAARASIVGLSQAVGGAVADLASLPRECAASQLSMNDTDGQARLEIGPLPDAVVMMLHAGDLDVRMAVVVPGILAARVSRESAEADVLRERGQTLAKPASHELEGAASQRRGAGLDRTLARVPIDLALDMGHARVPLAHVLHLQEGEVLELKQLVDAPVSLVSEETAVARGRLEVSERGTLVLNVTSIPGQRGAPGLSMAPEPATPPGGALRPTAGDEATGDADGEVTVDEVRSTSTQDAADASSDVRGELDGDPAARATPDDTGEATPPG